MSINQQTSTSIQNYIQNLTLFGNQTDAFNFISNSGSLLNNIQQPQRNLNIEGFSITGPPGTGKTFIICVGTLAFCLNSVTNRVLICTKTNAASHRIIDGFLKIFNYLNLNQFQTNFLVRLANDNNQRNSFPNYIQIYTHSPYPSTNVHVQSISMREKEEYIRNTRIWVGTIYQGEKFLRRVRISPNLILFDEASQLNPPEVSLVLSRCNRLNAVGFIGDPHQLSPIGNIDRLTRDIMSYLTGLIPHIPQRINRTTTLNYQMRMNPTIAELSFAFGRYNIQIHNHPNTQNEFLSNSSNFTPPNGISQNLNNILESNNVVIVLDTTPLGTLASSQTALGTSQFNPIEAEIATAIWNLLRLSYPNLDQNQIKIIFPYRAQRFQFPNPIFQNAGTVDKFQGQEAQVVILSLVKSDIQGSAEFPGDENRLNVSLSRAKKKLIIIGNRRALTSTNPQSFDPIFNFPTQRNNAEFISINNNLMNELRNYI